MWAPGGSDSAVLVHDADGLRLLLRAVLVAAELAAASHADAQWTALAGAPIRPTESAAAREHTLAFVEAAAAAMSSLLQHLSRCMHSPFAWLRRRLGMDCISEPAQLPPLQFLGSDAEHGMRVGPAAAARRAVRGRGVPQCDAGAAAAWAGRCGDSVAGSARAAWWCTANNHAWHARRAAASANARALLACLAVGRLAPAGPALRARHHATVALRCWFEGQGWAPDPLGYALLPPATFGVDPASVEAQVRPYLCFF
jgi:hypothetical protein